jgi:hypothetical protein
MELMDDSLTHFLESSTQPIPYHIQVNFCHDVTLALSFLHSNDLIHRDLSSNNVLLTKGATRAKVTDFGMTQLYNLNPFRTNTMCPGTAVYMPPEALQGRPEYSEKIDCFSFGVIVLQVLTRQYPSPTDHQRKFELNHPGVPRGQLMVCVPEIERRNNHIRLVDPHHSLLPIVQDCLRDREGERPTAKQLCERVAILKDSSMYAESEKVNVQQVQGLQQILKSQTKRLEGEIQKLRQELGRGGERDQTIAQLYQALEYKDRDVAKKGEENERLRRQVDQAVHSQQIIQQQDRMIAEKEGEIERLRWQLERANVAKREKDEINYRVIQQKEQAIVQKQREIEQLEELLRQKDQTIRQLAQEKESIFTGKNQEIRLLRIQLQQATLQERPVAEVKQNIGQVHVAERQVQVQPVPAAKLEGEKANIVQENRPPRQRPKASEKVDEAMDIKKLRWREGPAALEGMKKASNAAVSGHDNVVYVLPYHNRDTTVHKFDIETSLWSRLKSFPYRECSLVVVKDLPTVIGGKQGLATYYNSLFSFTGEGKWTKIFASMPTARANPSVMVVGENHLFVIGGNNADGPLDVIEVMNTETQEWIRLAPFPALLMNALIATCGGNVYVLGGRDGTNKASKSVYTSSLEVLLSNQPNAWQKIADLPLSESTCVSLHGQVLAIGGVDAANQSAKSVYVYEQATNSWKAIAGDMLSERHSCFVAVLPDNQLMVVGGVVANNQTNSVEFGSIE